MLAKGAIIYRVAIKVNIESGTGILGETSHFRKDVFLSQFFPPCPFSKLFVQLWDAPHCRWSNFASYTLLIRVLVKGCNLFSKLELQCIVLKALISNSFA